MHLKRIEILGFKSFKDKTKLDFSPGVTAIIGPNGSGKSNVVDSIRWVLGEQNPKSLRGGKMEDIIFAGGSTKGPLGYAGVSLVLENQDKYFPLPFDEVIITRKLYRSGESEYLINNALCRLKDITELFMDTGLGKDGYSIVGQGDIESLLSPAHRRNLFQEAAGINKHKTRRDTTIHKLGKEKENLLRVQDIIQELNSGLPALFEESRKAELFLRLKEELKLVRINLFVLQEEKLTGELEANQEKIQIIQNQIKEDEEKKSALTDALKENKEKLEALENKERSLNQELIQNKLRLTKIESELNSSKEQLENLDSTIEKLENQIEKALAAFEQNAEKEEEYLKEKEGLTTKISQLLLSTTKKQTEIADINKELKILEKTTKELSMAKFKLEALNSPGKGVQSVLDKNIKGVINSVGRLIKVPPYLQIALDIALGSAAQNLVVETGENARLAIEYLKSIKGGRATFLPISSIKPKVFGESLPKGDFVIGKAKDLISYEDFLENIMSHLLEDTVIVDNLNEALKLKTTYRLITLEGDVISRHGAITGGSINPKQKEKLDLMKQIESILKYNPLEKEKKLSKVKEDLDNILTKEKIEINSLRNQLNFNEKLIKQMEIQNQGFLRDTDYLKKELEAAKSLEEKKENYLKTAVAEIEELKAKEAVAETSRVSMGEEILKIKKTIEQLEEESKSQGQTFLDSQGELYRLNNKIDTIKERSTINHNQLWDDYELTYQRVKTVPRLGQSYDKLKSSEKRLREEIKDLGPVNLQAPGEYSKLKERYDFLKKQKEDIENTTEKLKTLINSLTSQMEEQFAEQIEIISGNFDKMFKEMFGGGSGTLEITNKDKILESEIGVVVQLPGKRLQSLNLMSLGEKTLTAIALLFAILQIRPSPFLLLDEIEAALDHSNNIKFANYLKNFKGKMQFVLITHKRLTMEAASFVYGVTMDEGVSKVVSIEM